MVRRVVKLDVGWAESDELDTVEVGDRLVARSIRVTFPGADGQPQLEMTIDSSSGVPRCAELRLVAVEGGREVRTTDLRLVAVEDWIEVVVPAFMDEITERSGGGITAVTRVADSDADYSKKARRVLRQARRADRRKVTPELLRKVAEVYTGNEPRPAEAVEVAFVVSARTAYRYIKLARVAGFIDEKRSEST